MAKLQGKERAAGILRMKKAQSAGLSASAFIKTEQIAGRAYRRQVMLSDWRNVGNITVKTNRLRFVRKDRVPTAEIAQVKDWNMSREFMFVVQVKERLSPGEPITTRHVNIMADSPMTPRQIEEQVVQEWAGWYAAQRREVIGVVPLTAIRKVN